MDTLRRSRTTKPQSLTKRWRSVEEAKKNLERTIKERAAKADVAEDTIRDTIIAETNDRRFKVEYVPLGEHGPFYQPQQRGLQTVLQINVNHKFYTDVYSKIPAEKYEIRVGLELMLFTLPTPNLTHRVTVLRSTSRKL